MGRKCIWTSDVVNSYFPLYCGGTNSPTQWIDTIARWKTCSARLPLVWNVIRLFAPAARRERLSPLAAHWGMGRRDGWYFRLIRHDEQYACLSKNQRSKTKWRDRPLGRLQNSRVFFFPQIAKRRHSVRVSHEAREPHTPYGRPFSASLQTFLLFDVTVRAYLATRKYGLACVCSLSSGSAYHIILSFWRSRALYHNTAKTQGWRSTTPPPCVPL